MKILSAIIAFYILLTGCAKDPIDDSDDLQGDATISGQLLYQDLYNGRGEEKILAGKKVFISYMPSDSVNYIYYTITDAQGNFTFKRLYEKDYLLFTSDSIGNILYSSYQKVTPPQSAVKLLAQNDTVRQNGIMLFVLDEKLQAIKGAEVGIFNNEAIFNSDTTNALSLDKKTTDMYGRALFYNLKQGTYYLRSRATSSNGTLTADDSVSFSGKGIRNDTIILKSSLYIKNTLVVKTVDEQNNSLPNIPFCLFNNPLLFNIDTCLGYTKTDVTKEDGSLKINNMPAGNYYFFSHTRFNGQDYKAKLTSAVTASGTTTVTLILKKVVAANEFDILVKDATGTPVGGTDLYFFNSRVLFQADTTLGFVLQQKTGSNGKIHISNMEEGLYFIRARAEYGNLKLKGADSIVVTNGMIIPPKTIIVK